MSAECLRFGDVGYMNSFPDISMPGFDMDAYNKRFHDANVIIDAKSQSIYYGDHWSALSVKCAANGAEFYKCGDAMYRVDDECFLVFNEGKEYSSWIDADKAVSSFTFTMSPSFEKQALDALKSVAAGLIEDTTGVEKIWFTERLYLHQPGVSDLIKTMRVLACDLVANHLRLQELFFSLYLHLTNLQENSNREAMSTGKVSSSARRELFSRLLRARDFLHSCYNRDITLDHLAEIACLNPYYLLREFRKAFSNTPHQYLTARRVSQAMKLLSSGKMDVAEVCVTVGFIDQSSFSKLFRRHTGKSPSEYGKLFGRQ